MVNWKDIGSLHVISKLQEILHEWFGVELIFADSHNKIQGKQLEKGYESENHFFKVQTDMNYGYEYINQDIEKVNEILRSSDNNVIAFESFFEHVKGVASKIEVEGEIMGTAIAYPFVTETITQDELDGIKKKMIECGSSEEDATGALEHIKIMSPQEKEFLRNLIELVAEEVITFHEEITKRENRITDLNSELGEKYRYHAMIGKSKGMQDLYNLLEKISSSESSVFVQGANGTGKELVAKAVHFHSPRKENMFLAVNCSAFNDNLLDSELFGHVKGAFTGAIKDKKGLFEQADMGTLFLDEIGDTSLSMQVKLLRVLQEGTFLPVGASGPRKADVRIIAATNKNIKEMIASGEFREDLYYRINVINVNLPPLKDRGEDIPVLIDHFLAKRCGEAGVPTKIISKKCLEKMLNYNWPGNVRELENEIERLFVLSGDEKTIHPENLSPRLLEFGSPSISLGDSSVKGLNLQGSLKEAMKELEIIMIKEGLNRFSFNKSKVARELGISRASLIMKVEKYELDKRSKNKPAA